MAKKPRSGGPRTEAGKARSSQNARKHGLLTEKIFILQTEDPIEWQKLQDTWIAKLQPKDDIELLAVNRIAFAIWRMHRLWAMETAAIDKEMDDQASAFDDRYGADEDPFLRGSLGFEAFAAKEHGAGLMHRYQGHLERCYTRAFKAFMDLRTKTKLLKDLEEQERVQSAPIHAKQGQPQQDQNQPHTQPRNAETRNYQTNSRTPRPTGRPMPTPTAEAPNPTRNRLRKRPCRVAQSPHCQISQKIAG